MNTCELLLFLCCIAAQETAGHSASRGQVLYAMAPQDRGAYFINTKSGKYNYGYNTGDGIAKVEVMQPDGSIVGSYRYYDPTGKQVVRSYVADKRGFRVLGNDLPISPDTPVSHVMGLPAFTGAVEGTDEFVIPPPLQGAAAHTSQQQYRSHQQHLLKEQQLLERQQSEYRRQQEKLEAIRQQLRELEAQQLELQQRVSDASHNRYTYEYPTQDPAQHLSVRNHLTHGYTSPYRYFERDIDYDFPAGFAYAGLPTIVTPPRTTRYPESSYVIGRAR